MSQAYPTQNYPRQGMSGWQIFGIIVLVIISLLGIAGGVWWSLDITGRNVLVAHTNEVERTFGGINNAAQKRADTLPNIARSVERFAKQEVDVLEGVTKARASATGVTLPQGATAEQIEAFNKAQAEISAVTSKFLVIAEKYPELKSDKLFLDLNKDIRDSEIQMSGARAAYMRAVAAYNNNVQSWPWNGYAAAKYGYVKKPQLDFPNAAQNRAAPPTLFDKK